MLSQKLRQKSTEKGMKHKPLATTHMYTHTQTQTHTLIHIETCTPVHKHQNVYIQCMKSK